MMDLNVITAKQTLVSPPEVLSNIHDGTESAFQSAGLSIDPSSNGQNGILDSSVFVGPLI